MPYDMIISSFLYGFLVSVALVMNLMTTFLDNNWVNYSRIVVSFYPTEKFSINLITQLQNMLK